MNDEFTQLQNHVEKLNEKIKELKREPECSIAETDPIMELSHIFGVKNYKGRKTLDDLSKQKLLNSSFHSYSELRNSLEKLDVIKKGIAKHNREKIICKLPSKGIPPKSLELTTSIGNVSILRSNGDISNNSISDINTSESMPREMNILLKEFKEHDTAILDNMVNNTIERSESEVENCSLNKPSSNIQDSSKGSKTSIVSNYPEDIILDQMY